MLETMICALFTVFPDFLYRRFVQGKRLGHEITLFTMWYELRWGLTTCAILALTVITTLFYFHPATSSVASYFRTVTILPQAGGRVSEVFVRNNELVTLGQPIFRLDDHSQRAQVEAAKAQIAEVQASLKVAETDLTEAEASIAAAAASLAQAAEDLARNETLRDEGSSAVRLAEVERLENLVAERTAQMNVAEAQQAEAQERIDTLIPAQLANAFAQLDAAIAELDKTVVYAGVTGRVEQFGLQVGDYVNPILRPAGILVPSFSGRDRFEAGFNQMAAQVIKPGMISEIGCMTKPFTVIPMVVVEVQDVIPSGQVQPSDRILEPQNNPPPGSITVYLEPLYEGRTDGLPPGSNCIANVYTDTHELLEDPDLSTMQRAFYHVVGTIGVVHAAGLRLRLLLMPVQTLVFTGAH
ncbi:MAG: biotin/lipoyl-binding protein [Pseudomonadota bacterium]